MSKNFKNQLPSEGFDLVGNQKNEKIQVSIIIPFHKGKHFLKDCLDSLMEQKIRNIETILVCDHIEENIDKLMEGYKKKLNLKVYSLDESTGVAAARNLGLKMSSGEYVYFIDSDDYLFQEALDQLMEVALLEKADIIYGRKKSTWFKRKVFLDSYMEDETQDDDQFEQVEDKENKEKLWNSSEGDEEEQVMEQASSTNQEELEVMVREEAIKRLVKKRKGLKNISVLHILFKRDMLNEYNILFNEKFTFYSDMPFLLHTMTVADSFSFVAESIYVKRKHNDPINYPSISQTKSEEKFNEYVHSYEVTTGLLVHDPELRKIIDKKLINYYANFFATRLRRSEYGYWKDERFAVMRLLISQINQETIKELKGYKKRVIKALLKGNLKKSLHIVNLHLGFIKLKKIRKNRRVFGTYLYFNFFTKLPIKEDVVLCESFFGKSYSDSPKYIYKYLNEHEPGKYKYVWIIDNKKTVIPYNTKKVKRFSLRYFYYMARSKYFVFNSRQPVWFRKREGSVFLQTWHGTPLKRLVFDQEEVRGASPLYLQQFYNQSRIWDYLVSDNPFSTEVFRRAFKFDNEIVECGYPRNDLLYAENKDEIANKIKDRLKIPKDKKTILYAPTWRDDEYYGPGQYKFALKMDLHRMKEELGDEYVILLRTHYFIADALDVSGLEDFAFNVSKYDDITHLYLISDILITDYSSVFFDYANLKRPILFYTYDMDKYRDMLRGFYLDMEREVPGPCVFTEDQVIEAIRNIDEIKVEYSDKYDKFYDRFCSVDDGNASKRIVEKVFRP